MASAIEIWQQNWDPYLQDLEIGFMKFLETWERRNFADKPDINWKDFIPPCIQCLKDETCQRGWFYRKEVNGKSQLVCDRMIHRIHGTPEVPQKAPGPLQPAVNIAVKQ